MRYFLVLFQFLHDKDNSGFERVVLSVSMSCTCEFDEIQRVSYVSRYGYGLCSSVDVS